MGTAWLYALSVASRCENYLVICTHWPCRGEDYVVICTVYDQAEVRTTGLSAHCMTRQKWQPSSYPHTLWPGRGENYLVICMLYDQAEVRTIQLSTLSMSRQRWELLGCPHTLCRSKGLLFFCTLFDQVEVRTSRLFVHYDHAEEAELRTPWQQAGTQRNREIIFFLNGENGLGTTAKNEIKMMVIDSSFISVDIWSNSCMFSDGCPKSIIFGRIWKPLNPTCWVWYNRIFVWRRGWRVWGSFGAGFKLFHAITITGFSFMILSSAFKSLWSRCLNLKPARLDKVPLSPPCLGGSWTASLWTLPPAARYSITGKHFGLDSYMEFSKMSQIKGGVLWMLSFTTT